MTYDGINLDPRTGEILEADVRMFHNIMKLVRDWYFVQASPSDPRAQELPMPDDLIPQIGFIRHIVEAFGIPAIAVDTHVKRVSNRLGLTASSDPVKIEFELRDLYPERDWEAVSMRFIQFGRDVCDARKPACPGCPLADRCAYPDKTVE